MDDNVTMHDVAYENDFSDDDEGEDGDDEDDDGEDGDDDSVSRCHSYDWGETGAGVCRLSHHT